MIIRIIIILLCALYHGNAMCASSITQYGITWTFDTDYT